MGNNQSKLKGVEEEGKGKKLKGKGAGPNLGLAN